MTRELAESFNLKQLPDDFYDDPFRYYRALRENSPVKRMRDGCCVTSAADPYSLGESC